MSKIQGHFKIGVVVLLLQIQSEIIDGLPVRSKNSNNEEKAIDTLKPILREMKFLGNELNITILPDMQTLYYGTLEFINVADIPSAKLTQIEQKLRKSSTILELLNRILIFLKKYHGHLKTLQSYELRTGYNDLSKTIGERKKILTSTKEKADLTIFEIERGISYLNSDEETDFLEKDWNSKNISLLKIEISGNYCKMLKQDLHFLTDLKSFVDISVKQLEYRLDVQNDL